MTLAKELLVAVTLVLCLLPHHVVSASFVYEDVLAYPRYHVVLTENKIPESQLSGTKKTEDEARLEQHELVKQTVLMKTANGQPFLCNIPNVDEAAERERQSMPQELSESETQQSIERGLKLLEPLTKNCLYFHTHGYWTYEYCHMTHVRQFHVDRTAIQGDKPVPLRQVGAGQSFYLGYFNPKDKTSGKPEKQHTDVAKHRDGSVAKTSMRHIGDQRYLTQFWEGGTVCDLTGKPRSIEIQFHCDRQMHDHISMFQEVATCQYQMVISTPRLCEEMLLTSQKKSTSNKIQCNPVVADHLISAKEETTHEVEKDQDVFVDALTEQEDTYQDQLEDEQDEQQALLATIAELTAQIQDLQRQIKDPKIFQNSGNDQDEIIEVAFFHLDDNGEVVADESLPMSELIRQIGSRNTKQVKEQSETRDEDQQKNKRTYNMKYFH